MKPGFPRLWLDYRRPAPRRPWLGIGLLLGSLALAGDLIQTAREIAAEQTAGERRLAHWRLAAERQTRFAPPAAPAGTTARVPQVRPWETLFTDLEAASAAEVTLLSLVPGPKEIVITGEAVGVAAALDYSQRLQAAKGLQRAYLAQYEVVRSHPRQPVRFTVLAQWREAD